VTFNESLETFVDDLKSARVTSFLSVPRLWMKFQAGVLANLPQKKLDRLLKIPFVSGMVKKKIRAQLGLADVTSCGSGSAPVAPSVLEWYQKLDIPISEGWGMTEVTGLGSTQFPFRADKIGTIGKAVEGLEIKTSGEGEILVKGEGVFMGYYKDDKTTAETFTEDGWMRTGDRAEMDEEGYLRITGRVKELFKSGKGKYVAPAPIEGSLGENQLIEQICVMGSGLPKPIAVMVLSPEISQGMSQQEIAESLEQTLDSVNAKLEKHEVLGGIRIANETWSVENGLLTPTLKIKRDQLEQKYQSLISRETSDKIVWE
jgi:long-chain acyl-CoA synthetase